MQLCTAVLQCSFKLNFQQISRGLYFYGAPIKCSSALQFLFVCGLCIGLHFIIFIVVAYLKTAVAALRLKSRRNESPSCKVLGSLLN